MHKNLSLVIRRSARVQKIVAHRRLKRRRLPQLQRLGRLKIVEETAEGFRIPDVMRLHEFLEFLQMREKFGDE